MRRSRSRCAIRASRAQRHNGHICCLNHGEAQRGRAVLPPSIPRIGGGDGAGRGTPLPAVRCAGGSCHYGPVGLRISTCLPRCAVVRRFWALCATGAASAQPGLAQFLEKRRALIKTSAIFWTVMPVKTRPSISRLRNQPAPIWAMGWRQTPRGRRGRAFCQGISLARICISFAYHTPHISTDNWRSEWDSFPWATDPDAPQVLAWKQAAQACRWRIDAAMRELYVTGRMHNRARCCGLYLDETYAVPLADRGLDWFADCLIDWDPCRQCHGLAMGCALHPLMRRPIFPHFQS